MKWKGREITMGIDTAASGKQIALLMKVAGLTPKELSEVMGVTVQAIYKWKRGECLPDTENMFILSQMLGVKIDDMIVPYPKRCKENAADNIIASTIQRLRTYFLCIKVIRFSHALNDNVHRC